MFHPDFESLLCLEPVIIELAPACHYCSNVSCAFVTSSIFVYSMHFAISALVSKINGCKEGILQYKNIFIVKYHKKPLHNVIHRSIDWSGYELWQDFAWQEAILI